MNEIFNNNDFYRTSPEFLFYAQDHLKSHVLKLVSWHH